MKNLVSALFTEERIQTTNIKAKELRRVADRLITLGKRGDVHARRLAYRRLGNHQLVQRLFDDIAPRFANRPGGYTRIYRLSDKRKGDNADLALIELVVREEVSTTPKTKEKKSTAKKDTKGKKVEAKEAKPEEVKKEKKSFFRRKSKSKEDKEETRAASEERGAVRQDADSRSRKIHRKSGRGK